MTDQIKKQLKDIDITPDIFGRVAVLMGGDSAEREVSLKSGTAALNALLRKGVNAFGLDISFKNNDETGSLCEQLKAQSFDRAFIALHGRGGEDGVIQGMLQALNIPYSGCGVAASAIGMDKLRTKLLWSGSGLPTPAFDIIKREQVETDSLEQLLASLETKLNYPVMVKPVHEGSSIGMAKANDQTELKIALKTAAEYDNEILVEQWIAGKEYTGAVLDDVALPLIRLETPRDFYDYQAKYISDDTIYYCPCGLDEDLEKRYQELVLEAFDRVGAKGWGRIDFMCDAENNPWLIEINTVPGLTDHSLVPMAAKELGIDFDELIYRLLMTTMAP